MGYDTRSGSPVAGLMFQHSFSSHVRIAPTVDYYFRLDGVDALAVSLNMHFPYRIATPRTSIYPLVGLNYTSWNYNLSDGSDNDVTTRVNRLGLDAGAGFEWMATSSLKLSVEAKANILKSYSSGTFTASIAYVF